MIHTNATHQEYFCTRIIRTALLALSLTLMTGCQNLLNHEPIAPEVDKLLNKTDRPVKPARTPEATESAAADTKAASEDKSPEFYPGNGIFTGQTPGDYRQEPGAGKGDVTLNFQDTDIHEVVKVVIGDLLKKNYVIDPAVSGTVNIHTSEPLQRDALMPVMENLLQMSGAAMLEEGGLIKIIPLANAALESLPARSARRLNSKNGGYQTVIVPLHYIGVEEMQKILQPFIKDTIAQIDPQRNLIILSGRQADLNRLVETIGIFDVDWLRGMSLAMVPLNSAESKDIVHELDEMFGKSSGSPLAELVRFISVERLNSVIVITQQPRYLKEMSDWIRRLDRSDGIAGQKLNVYRVQNSRAADLAEVLNNIFGDQQTSSFTQQNAELAPGLEPVTMQSDTSTDRSDQSAQTTQKDNQQRPAVSVAGNSDVTLPSAGAVKIIADETNNSLVILASPSDYQMVESALSKLDITPLQVLIEASIIEVTLTDDLSYGLEWFFKNETGIGNKNGRATLDLGEEGLKALAPGFSYAVVDAADAVRAVLNTLASESKVNVLSSPSLMVLDNHTASINVGDQVPIPTRRSVSNLDPQAPTVNEIEYRDTGVLLTVTPRVNESGLVILEVKQEVSDVSETKSVGVDAPTINQRTIESTIAVDSGNTIVLGGLIRDNRSNSESGIPGLYKTPIIGPLFGQTSDKLRRTELVVLLTPRAIHNEEDAWEITNEVREKLRNIGNDLRQEHYPDLGVN